MIRPQIYQQAVNDYWKIKSQTDDAFYFGLGDRIKQRQESKVPVAGAGTVQFLQLTGAVIAGVSVFVPAFRPLTKAINFAQEQLKEKTESTE